MRPSHREVDPLLEPVAGPAEHAVACLLEPEERHRLWAELAAGADPEAAKARGRPDAAADEGSASDGRR